MPAGAVHSDEEVRQIAAEILRGDDYARFRIDEQAWLVFFQRLDQGLEGLRAWFEALRFESPWLYWGTLALLTLVALVLLFHVAWSIRVALRTGDSEEAGAATPVRRLAEEAARLAASGRYLEAARRLEHACLETLLVRGVIELGRSDANPVLRRRLEQAELPAPRRRELLALIDRLEARLFRDPSEDADLYRGWQRLHAQLQGGGAL